MLTTSKDCCMIMLYHQKISYVKMMTVSLWPMILTSNHSFAAGDCGAGGQDQNEDNKFSVGHLQVLMCRLSMAKHTSLDRLESSMTLLQMTMLGMEEAGFVYQCSTRLDRSAIEDPTLRPHPCLLHAMQLLMLRCIIAGDPSVLGAANH